MTSKLKMISLFDGLDRPLPAAKKAPPTGPFPLWSTVAVWHDGLQCYVHGARYFPNVYGGFVRIYVAATNCTDFSGTLDAALAGDREVRLIEVFSGYTPDTAYMIDAEGEWQCGPSQPSQPIDEEGEPMQLPPARAEQTSANDLPKMPFADRPGTTRGEARAAAVAALNKAVDEKVKPLSKARVAAAKRIEAIETARDEAMALLDARLGGSSK